MLAVDDLHVRFQTDGGLVYAVNGISFHVERGETLGIVGESGSGKSAASLAIMGLLGPNAVVPRGTVTFAGQSLLGLPAAERRKLRGARMAMIFQDPMTSLNPYLRISRQLTEVLEVHKGLSDKEALRRAIAMLERVGLPDASRRVSAWPHELSGGMRQRVMIAMSLLCEPELLIADEPTTALDVTIQAQILELLKTLQRDLGMAVVLVTHDLGVVAGTTDRVLVMYGGLGMEQRRTADLFADPRHPYTRGLLRSVPRLDTPRGEPLRAIPGAPPILAAAPVACPFAPRCEQVMDRCRASLPPDGDVRCVL